MQARSVLNSFAQSLQGGVTLVQIREKTAETGEVRPNYRVYTLYTKHDSMPMLSSYLPYSFSR